MFKMWTGHISENFACPIPCFPYKFLRGGMGGRTEMDNNGDDIHTTGRTDGAGIL